MWRQNPRSEPEAGAATAAMAATAAATAVHGADGEQDDNRADDGGHPGAEVKEGVEGADVERTWNMVLATQPPSSAPTIPATVAMTRLVRSPVSFSAMMPATAPSTIQARMPMTTPVVVVEV